MTREEILFIFSQIKNCVDSRLEAFRRIKANGTDEQLFEELVFCLFTPQTKSTMAGKAVGILKEKDLLLNGSCEEISREINIVRFRNNKARYVVEARNFFSSGKILNIRKKLEQFKDIFLLREWLVIHIKGLGYKEAGHFLRNTGFSFDLAILDRHILRNMQTAGIFSQIPDSLNPKKYLEIEEKLREFSSKIKIPMSYLDFIWFYHETGEIYK